MPFDIIASRYSTFAVEISMAFEPLYVKELFFWVVPTFINNFYRTICGKYP